LVGAEGELYAQGYKMAGPHPADEFCKVFARFLGHFVFCICLEHSFWCRQIHPFVTELTRNIAN
jgi:hypothetical protein